ncbi:hypothetical protein [Rhodohalobacter halophilus]|uniref:hypothetical protein n=1 Tax=Rhodohalobacter halophilus TaxID=1812810 RepID=UPI00114CA961|nr:hypothetical protein [Rhodohalobacter halophilus]
MPVIYKSILSCLLLVITMIGTPQSIDAQHNSIFNLGSTSTESKIVSRVQSSEADLAISNREKSVDLLIIQDAVVLQFTNDFLDDLEREISGENEISDEPYIAEIIRSAVSSGVKTMLSKAIAVPFSEIESVRFEEGRIVMINTFGEELFSEIEIDDTNIMEDFRRRDARRFVSEAERRLK